MNHEKEYKALEAVIAAAMDFEEPITEIYVAEKNLPVISDEELEASRKKIPNILEVIKKQAKNHQNEVEQALLLRKKNGKRFSQ